MKHMKGCLWGFVLLCCLILFAACTPSTPETNIPDPGSTTGQETDWRIRVVGPDGNEAWSFNEAELNQAIQPSPSSSVPMGEFTHVYSTINNWPTARFYAAQGYTVESILQAAGLLDEAEAITFRSHDGYEVTLTKEQLQRAQYYFPQVGENDTAAEQVFPIIAYAWREGSSDLAEMHTDVKPCLIIGQSNYLEHTNPAFVEEIEEIIVSDQPAGPWPAAGTFPAAGRIVAGETVKLQHPDFGLVKLHYTLDGTDPTPFSAMYNPSTYQPELNKPIPIHEPTTIKVLVTGFGKGDSAIVTFEFTTQ